jgi:transposase
VYWIPLFQILEERALKVCLVNARYVKNVPGRKTDVSDCQWLQYLHAVGLLRASFRPEQQICAVRSLMRYRESLIQMAAVHLQHMQKGARSDEPAAASCHQRFERNDGDGSWIMRNSLIDIWLPD